MNSHVLKAIGSFILDDSFYIYDLIDILGLESTNRIQKKLDKILCPLKKYLPLPESQTKNDIKEAVTAIFKKFNQEFEFNIDEEEIDLFLDSVSNSFFRASFVKASELHKVMTVFSAKGLEFNQIISFSSYYTNFTDRNQLNNHYVCITRAEEKVIILETSEKEYSKKINQVIYENDVSLSKNTFTVLEHI